MSTPDMDGYCFSFWWMSFMAVFYGWFLWTSIWDRFAFFPGWSEHLSEMSAGQIDAGASVGKDAQNLGSTWESWCLMVLTLVALTKFPWKLPVVWLMGSKKVKSHHEFLAMLVNRWIIRLVTLDNSSFPHPEDYSPNPGAEHRADKNFIATPGSGNPWVPGGEKLMMGNPHPESHWAPLGW